MLALLFIIAAFTTMPALVWGQPAKSFKAAPSKGTDSKLVALTRLNGTYADPAPYAYGKAFGHRTFKFAKGTWELLFTLSLDPEQKMPVFSCRTKGTYRVEGTSSKQAGAYNAVFRESKKWLTLRTKDAQLAKAFGLDNCGLTAGLEQDISASGCALWQYVTDAGNKA